MFETCTLTTNANHIETEIEFLKWLKQLDKRKSHFVFFYHHGVEILDKQKREILKPFANAKHIQFFACRESVGRRHLNNMTSTKTNPPIEIIGMAPFFEAMLQSQHFRQF